MFLEVILFLVAGGIVMWRHSFGEGCNYFLLRRALQHREMAM